MLVVDYFSKFIEISKLRNETSEEVICHLKKKYLIFARHGIPQEYSFQTTVLNIYLQNFPTFQRDISLSTLQVALDFLRVIGKPSKLSTLLRIFQ